MGSQPICRGKARFSLNPHVALNLLFKTASFLAEDFRMKRFTVPAVLVVAICGTLSTAHAKQISNTSTQRIGIAFQDKRGEQEGAEVYAEEVVENSNGTFTIVRPYAKASSGTVVLFSTNQMTSDAVCKVIDRDRPFAIHASELGLVDAVFGDKSTAIAAFVAGARVLITEEQNNSNPSKIKTVTCSSERPQIYF